MTERQVHGEFGPVWVRATPRIYRGMREGEDGDVVTLRKLIGGGEGPLLEDPGTPGARLVYKQKVADRLHREADGRSWCVDFDRVMVAAELPVRPEMRNSFRQNVTGEETAEEFEAWRRRARRVLNFAGKRRQIPGYEAVLRELGLGGTVETVTATVAGTFRIEMPVQVMAGEDPAEGVDRFQLRDLLYRLISEESDRVTWQVTPK